ncbi:MAG: hypothetical protein ACRDO8_11935 [Nocardioidaceae bacterium]
MTFHGPGGEVDHLARGFETLDSTLDTLCGSLRDLDAEATGPRDAARSFVDALSRLERGLGRVGAQAREAAAAVRRFEAEEGGA